MPVTRHRPALLAALLLAGCVAPASPPATSPGGEAAAGTRTGGPKPPATAPSARPGDPATPPASAGPSAAPSAAVSGAPKAPVFALPSAAPLAVASAIAPPVITAPAKTPAPGASTNPFSVPKSVAIAIPVGLQALAGVTLIGNDGSTMVAAGGGNYRLAQAEVGQGAAFLLGINTAALLQTLAMVGSILQAVAPLNLQPDAPIVFDDDRHPGMKVTLVLRVAADHARLEAFRAPAQSFDPAHQYIGLRFTDEAHGKVVMRSLPGDAGDKVSIAETWDFTAGTLTADGAIEQADNGEGARQRTNARWELGKASEPAGAVFALRASMSLRKSNEDGLTNLGFAANFGADGGGAHWIKLKTPQTFGQHAFMPADGVSWLQAPPAPIGFYVGPNGRNLATGVPEGLKAILPAVETVLPAYPADPDDGDAYADPRFAFPR